MNLFHLLWILFLIIFFVIACFLRRGIMWGIVLAITTFLAYNAITGYWAAIFFAPILGIFIISIIGFIKDSLEGRLV